MTLENIIKEKKGSIVDVRTRQEYSGGHAAGSINIPLNEIQDRLEEIQNLESPLILCCASGNRSGQAQHYLSQKGIDCYNGGSWLDVNYYQSK
ncbi:MULTISPECIES: rhodanese-like domain-containing protein [Flavobacterium]|uniref:rhodanese-like domain-containing protein n=1 Tax=Flavobacterium TaxID=237 RepID=UPI00188A1E93|nr:MULTISPECIES: rhodanese-like domain-containing protein [Flavobacterium]MBF4473225.1 rhodanese-like domain-containing protein [Flavobacterium sp. HJJ]